MPEGLGVVEFCRGIVDAVAGIAVAVKPQAAFFEAQGVAGWAALVEVCGYAREAGLLVIADAKRGDVPSTARAYAMQDSGMDTVEANEALGHPADRREYGIGSQILFDLGVRKMRILTNNPRKYHGVEGIGLEVVEQVPIRIHSNPHNERYLQTKKEKMGHLL